LNLEKDSLIVFDVDEVLLITEDTSLHPDGDEYLNRRIQTIFSSLKTLEEKREVERRLSLAFVQPKRRIIEPPVVPLIGTLQKKEVKTVALTHSPRGSFGLIPSLEDWRIKQLEDAGIFFSASFPSLAPFELDTVSKKIDFFPLYKKGVLFSSGYTKGEVLNDFYFA